MNNLKAKLIESIANLPQDILSKNETKYNCPKCKDSGYILVKDKNDYEIAYPCHCLEKMQIFERLSNCGLSEVFKKKTLSSYNCETKEEITNKRKALIYCNDYNKQPTSLLISGGVGSGKTHLGIGAMLNLIEQNINCRYVEYHNMLVSLKQSIMDEESHTREINKYLNPKILFIDDFLKGKVTQTDSNYIYRIVNTRYLQNKHMIISTEKTIGEMLEWDEAIASRIIEMSKDNILTFGETQNKRIKKYLK